MGSGSMLSKTEASKGRLQREVSCRYKDQPVLSWSYDNLVVRGATVKS